MEANAVGAELTSVDVSPNATNMSITQADKPSGLSAHGVSVNWLASGKGRPVTGSKSDVNRAAFSSASLGGGGTSKPVELDSSELLDDELGEAVLDSWLLDEDCDELCDAVLDSWPADELGEAVLDFALLDVELGEAVLDSALLEDGEPGKAALDCRPLDDDELIAAEDDRPVDELALEPVDDSSNGGSVVSITV